MSAQISFRLAFSACGLLLALQTTARASSVVVPDQFATIQSGIDSGADTVLIRSGNYDESPYSDRSIVLLGIGPGRPRIQQLILSNHEVYGFPRVWKVSGLAISQLVEVHTDDWPYPDHNVLSFEQCALELGLVQYAVDIPALAEFEMVRCNAGAGLYVLADVVRMEDDTLNAGARLSVGYDLTVRRSSFTGPAEFAIYVYGDGNLVGTIADNSIANYISGVTGRMEGLLIANNVIASCGTGLALNGGHFNPMVVRDNIVVDCGTGIHASVDGLSVIGNTVLNASGSGLVLERSYDPLIVERNIVGHCGGIGIEMRWGDNGTLLQHNTIFNNHGSGVVIEGFAGPIALSRNIVSGNGGWGLVTEGAVALGCNDWFGNAAGGVSGAEPGADDVAVDPLFCNVDSANVYLGADSPLLAGSCAPVGARGQGCDAATDVLVVVLMAKRELDGVAVQWRLGGASVPEQTWIERADAEAGPWRQVESERSVDGGVTADLDRSASAERGYWYRLAWVSQGEEERSRPVEIGASGVVRVGIESMSPNPTNGGLVVRYSLARSSEVELTVHDLMGRTVSRLDAGAKASGFHLARWNGSVSGVPAAPGAYFVRLRWTGGEESRRVLLRR